MAVENDSSVTEFILMGLTDQPELQLLIFFLLLVNYVVTVVGNLCLISLICLNFHLHTPMYFFLLNLSFIDFCYSFVFTPKMLVSLIHRKTSSPLQDARLSYFSCFFVGSECYVLTAMAYDCYVAICNPLLYMVTMSPRVCSLLISASYMMGIAGAMTHTGCMMRLTFCDSDVINHYMCDMFPLLQLSCTYANELVASIIVGTNIIVSSLIISISYALILLNILQMLSAKGWSKAFSTCGSHLLSVSLFYVFGLLTDVKPSSSVSLGLEKFFSLFYTNVVHILNPFVYSLRIKDVKLALKKTLKRIRNGTKPVVLP